MTETTSIIEAVATGEDINALCLRIEEALGDAPREHGIIALISLTLVMMHPDISPDDLQTGVRDVSKYICLLLEGEGTNPVPKERMN